MFHFDGEFASLRVLVRETLLGRNYGWLPSERKKAIAHIARVVRNDNGTRRARARVRRLVPARAGRHRRQDPGGARAAAQVPRERAEGERRRDRGRRRAADRALRRAARVRDRRRAALRRARRSTCSCCATTCRASPRRASRRSVHAAPRARRSTSSSAPLFVADVDGPFAFHAQTFVFDAEELLGLRIFLREAAEQKPEGQAGGVGNCVACHPAPFFTDFSFHNTGITQDEYDGVHGGGAFAALVIPSRSERAADPEAFLPADREAPGRHRPLPRGRRRRESRAHGPGRLEHPVQHRLPEGAGRRSRRRSNAPRRRSSRRTPCSTPRSAASRRRGCATSATRTRTCTTARATSSRT